jgi:Fumarylacetoacetate (FAA) hydrolase family
MKITLAITRDEAELYRDTCAVADMKRSLLELVDWLWRGQDLPLGAVLLTGTSIVPPPQLSLRPGDQVTISITGLGELPQSGGTPPHQPTASPLSERTAALDVRRVRKCGTACELRVRMTARVSCACPQRRYGGLPACCPDPVGCTNSAGGVRVAADADG